MALLNLSVALLALVGVFSSAAQVNRNPLKLSAKAGESTETTWGNSYHKRNHKDGFCSSAARLQCSNEKVTLIVRSPAEAYRVDIQAVLPYDNTRSPPQYPRHPNKNECSVSFESPNFPGTLSAIQDMPEQCPPSANPAPENLNEDYEQWLIEQQALLNQGSQPQIEAPVFEDLNADYADYLESMREKGRSGTLKQSTHAGAIFSGSIDKCGSGEAILNGVKNQHDLGDIVVLVTEFIRVPGTEVDLVTNTTVRLSCDICFNSPTGELEPVVKELQTAQCRNSSYSLSAEASLNDITVNISQSNPAHPDQDNLVGWQVQKLYYGQDEIVVNRTFTPVGNEVSGTCISPSDCRWSDDLQTYLLQTDNVVQQGSGSLSVSASVGYCYNSAFSAGVEVCQTPQC